MVFLPLVFGLEVLFTSKKTDHWMQIVAFSFIGGVWGLSAIGGLFGLFNTPSNILQSWTSHLACLMFLAICLVKVGALWYAMPDSLASNIVVGVIAIVICFGHIYSWAQVYLCLLIYCRSSLITSKWILTHTAARVLVAALSRFPPQQCTDIPLSLFDCLAKLSVILHTARPSSDFPCVKDPHNISSFLWCSSVGQ